ncbi:glycosyl transferase 4-like domain protein [Mycobacterium xenopi 4042]|uniref:Glycosyl transferase 4-like domain protein n=1 Tax=Mycobacterium xenopi 4042 TaxID=1299334 RepID=X8CAA5_MYCXE|nr:glycosyl transferase 4-like domain protein [Mycobacterium xenopi 4042]
MAIVAESFLPHVNGVSNSVVRIVEHLRRTSHEALVIAPDTPPGQPRAERVHDGIRVHRVPSRMFPKVTSLPLGLPVPGFCACCADSTPTSCIWPRRRCWATAGCRPPGA